MYFYKVPRVINVTETEIRMVVIRGWGTRNEEQLFNGTIVSVWEDEKVLDMDGGNECTTM